LIWYEVDAYMSFNWVSCVEDWCMV